ncbi:hypothetical protein GOODEAATRI_030172 [Goodea atripinnis]|uniref:Uncharacterized protein n=1 Tax=Goodea atripinnis TaxID=208336 RepID=A0ABV0PSV7_9TELE
MVSVSKLKVILKNVPESNLLKATHTDLIWSAVFYVRSKTVSGNTVGVKWSLDVHTLWGDFTENNIDKISSALVYNFYTQQTNIGHESRSNLQVSGYSTGSKSKV